MMIMRLRHTILIQLACYFTAVLNVLAHREPIGETHPRVNVEDEHFVIYNVTPLKDGERWARSRTIYTPEGKLLTPTERITDPNWKRIIWPTEQPTADIIELLPPNGESATSGKEEHLWLRSNSSGRPVSNRLTLSDMSSASGFKSIITPKNLGLIYAAIPLADDKEFVNCKPLAFSLISRPEFTTTKTIRLGQCALIYNPVTSNIVEAGNRLWFAWVRPAENFEKQADNKKWQTVLGNYNLATGAFEQFVLNEPSNWNTNLHLNTCNGWLCVAWHCWKDGGDPGQAMIVPHFQKLPDC